MGTYAAPLRLAAPKGGALTLRGAAANGTRNGRYRGALELRAVGGRLQAINALDLEDYVRGVVSAESPSTWPAEALKAQAVAARTYAVTTNVGTTTDGIDQYADTRSQMYKGVAAEYPTTDAAVAATAGQVVAQNGKPVTTYFFSTSGGHTENVEDSFIGALPQHVAQGRRRSVRRRLAPAQLGAVHLLAGHRAGQVEGVGPRLLPRDHGAGARRLAADRARRGRRHQRRHPGHRAAAARAPRAV